MCHYFKFGPVVQAEISLKEKKVYAMHNDGSQWLTLSLWLRWANNGRVMVHYYDI